MRVLERHTQTLEKGGWETYVAKEKKWEAREKRQGGFPTKRHFRPMSNWNGTVVVWEREWESFAAMEAAYEGSGGDPESKALMDVPSAIIDDSVELFTVATDV
jgi:hypothetical protein